MNASLLSLDHWECGDAVILDDDSEGSALNDSKKLGKMALAIKFATDATGVLKVVDGMGKANTINADTYAKGVWHPIKIGQILSTGSTVTDTKFELGYVRY